MPKASKIHLEGETDGVEGGKVPDELSGAPALYEQEVGILDGESGFTVEEIRQDETKNQGKSSHSPRVPPASQS